MLALMTITGVYDYLRLVGERERLEELSETEQRIFAETLALAVRRNIRRGRTTEEVQEVLDEIRERPGLIWVAIFDPKGQIVASSVAAGHAAPMADEVLAHALRTGQPISLLVGAGSERALRNIRP